MVILDGSISECLSSLGLAQYTSLFEDNGIDLEALALVSDSELEKLGVLLGHRKKILKAIVELSARARSSPTQPLTESRKHLLPTGGDLLLPTPRT